MKQFITILIMVGFMNFCQAQTNNYNNLWKKVEQFEKEGLPKSALNIVTQIETLAKKDKNKPQIIKTLLFKSKFALILQEDAQLKIINDFKVEISQSEAPTKQVVENQLAHLYWQYFQQNRHQFYSRTKTTNKVDANDFRTWDLQTLFNEIHFYFKNSLENKTLLQQTKLNAYKAILTPQKESKKYRPTLYDLLAHNALAFYKTKENSITKPVYKFEINNPAFLSDAAQFSALNIASKDTTSLQFHALKIYQDLIQFHQNKNADALANVNIERLKFVHQNATFNDKDDVFLNTLKKESNRTKNSVISALYDFEIASIYFQQGQDYKPKTNEEHRWKIKDALEICNTVIAKFPKSKGSEKCSVLKHKILNETLAITSEDMLPVQRNARIKIDYKNIEVLDFKIYETSREQLQDFYKLNINNQLAFITKLKTTTQWQNTLRNEKDYQQHSTEVLLPKLNNGTYFILATSPKNSKAFAYKIIQAADFAITQKNEDDKHTFQVINRNNGAPIIGANVTLRYQKNYNGKYETQNATTNQYGEISIQKTAIPFNRLTIHVNHNKQNGYFGNYRVHRLYNSNEKKVRYNSFLFTDRSIYRPSQIVYFKGIAMKTDDGISSILPNESAFVSLYNVNGELLKKMELTTNEFGSVHGEFILPNDGLTGNFRMEFNGNSTHFKGYTNFSVEEYKRPKFSASFKPVSETFKVNDTIAVTGNALAFAGSNITDAQVVYRVVRQVQYPRWYYWYRPAFYSEPQEIAHGETTTDASGNFQIKFKALPDTSVDKSSLPVFNYEITADVTDINGETRSATTTVNVGYHALIATMSVENTLDKTNKTHEISIDTKNLNGEFVAAKGNIKIYKLKAPNRVLRKRPWTAPDYQGFSKEEFHALFPHDAYNNEDDSSIWEKGKLVFEKRFDTEKSKQLQLGNIKSWQSGQYIILLESKDKFGQAVKDETKTTLFSNNDKKLSDNQLFNISVSKDTYQINDIVELCVGSSAKNIAVTIDVQKKNSPAKTHIITLDNEKTNITIPVTKNDVGGFAVHYSFSAFNGYQSGTLNINVPYPKTDLEIETITFRDKLQPAENETCTFKIKGSKGDKVSAELLASMYDASLDEFKPHQWGFNPISKPTFYSKSYRNAGQSFGSASFRVYNLNTTFIQYPYQNYDQFNWFGLYFGSRYYAKRGRNYAVDNMAMVENEAQLDEVVVKGNVDSGVRSPQSLQDSAGNINKNETKKPSFDNVQIRKNLQETAFFFPQLQTDKEGNVSFSFTTPEALTKWKLQLLAHTKTLESATTTLEAVTQKELMVIPNAPRFLREGDQITISSKIANISNKTLSGNAVLQLFDALSGKPIDDKLLNSKAVKSFNVNAKSNTQVSWQLTIPDDVQAVQYKIIAKAGDFSDGEQNVLPVLSNRMLVTETLPMWVRSNQTKTFTLDKLKNNTSTTLKHHNLTLEMTSNPAWYAVQALPYLMEYPHECNEQIFSRYYANILASHIANSNPRIQEVFNQWKNSDALSSNLEKNQELKSLLIQETPWLRDAQSETEQKKRIALLFDLNKMNSELQSALRKLQNNQMSNGGWSWFAGGRENRYITQHIITGFGHLKQLNVIKNSDKATQQMLQKAIRFLDAEFVKEYKNINTYNPKADLEKDHLSYTQLHYLYMRSFFGDIETSKGVDKIINYYHTQIQNYWLSRSLYSKGLMALILHRKQDSKTTAKILKSLKETSISSEELGMYWKSNTNSRFWYQAPIETQALLIEAFSEIENDTKTIDNLKIWLLKNKQTNQWKTTKATTDAVYALLLQGSDWLSVTDMVDVVLGGETISPSKLENVKVEAGTGYYKTSWKSDDIQPKMADVKLTKKGKGIAWGGLYWQYFEDLDKITFAETPLKLKKKLFLKTNADKGEEISEITSHTKLRVGDLVRIRIELRADRPMEFVHMKDMRAAGFEPVNVLSQYKWQDGLGYYESTKDAATNFFFDYLPKGIYVFEYDLRVNNAGDFSNGVTTIQSMYAPEFSSHSEGVRVRVD